MNEDYCNYKLSLALKRAGFDELCIAQWAYEPDGKPMLLGSTAFVFSNAELKGRDVTAPLLFHAQKWLREKKDICVTVYAQPYNGLPYYTGYILFEGDEKEVLDQDGHWFDDYEQCLSETIAAALELNKERKVIWTQ